MQFNIFNIIENTFNSYYSTIENFNRYKVRFENEVYEEWDKEVMDILGTVNFNNSCNDGENNETQKDDINNNSNIFLHLGSGDQGTFKVNIENKHIIDDNKEKEIIIKKLYRKIAKKSHPDKVKDEIKNNFFKKAFIFYENKMLIGLVYISNKLLVNIDSSSFNNNIIQAMFKEISYIQKKINEMQSSNIWKWNHTNNIIVKYTYKNNFIVENRLTKRV